MQEREAYPIVSNTKKWQKWQQCFVALAICLSAATASFAPTAAFAAGPSVNDVEAAIARGDMGQAQSMMDQVISAHPKSARAHYLDAQILERNHRYADALSHISTARTLDPSIGFTDRSRFEAVERRISTEAGQANSRQGNAATSVTPSQNTAMAVQPSAAALPAAHRGPSTMLWIILLLVVIAIVVVIRWSMRKRNDMDSSGAVDVQRDQLKRATALMDAVRATKLDLRLSAAPEKQSWISEADDVEAQLRSLIDSLSNSGSNGGNRSFGSPENSPAYLLESLGARVERLQALAAGRPDPLLHAGTNDPRSPYANEADRMSGNPYGQQPGWQQPQQQPQVIVQQQPSSGLGAGLGGLLGGVMLGEMLSGGNRERDVIVEHDRAPQQNPQQDASGGNAPFDFGNGGDNWGGGGGDNSQIDAGNDDNSWDDNS